MKTTQIVKLRWWVIINAIAALLVFVAYQGGFAFAWNADKTKISFVTLSVFVIVSAFIGYLTMQIEELYGAHPQHKRYINACWFASEFLMGLGLAGTTLGIILMFSGVLDGLNMADPTALKGALIKMAPGLTTALVTTFVGITTSMLTKLQLINYEVNLEDEKPE